MRPRAFLATLPLLLAHGTVGASSDAFDGDWSAAYPSAAQPAPSPAPGRIGIGLLDPPADHARDQRAQRYVVDHVGPGTELTRRFEISNTSDVGQRVELYAGAASIHGNAFTLAPGRTQNELTSWISVDSPVLTVPPHGRKVVSATVHIPDSASNGERYGVIWAEVSTRSPGPNGNLHLVNRVGIRVYLDVGRGGEPPSGLAIESLAPGRNNAGRPMVRARVHNTGRRALDLNGSLTLDDGPRGSEPVRLPAGDHVTLAPGHTAFVVVVLDSGLSAGPWTARLALQSGRVGDTATAEVSFPGARGSWEPATRTTPESSTRPALAGGALALLALVAGAFVFARRRRAALVLQDSRPAPVDRARLRSPDRT